MVILGFDASTTTVGYCFSKDKEILSCGFIDISKIDNNKDKTLHVIENLPKIDFDKIILESPMLGFGFGKTSQQTIIKLIRFNAIFEYIITEHYGKELELINVSTARKKVFGKSRIKGIKPKEFVSQEIQKIVDIDKFAIYNKLGNLDKRMSDVYDAIVLSLAG